jgi:hypothetical protein
MVINNPPKSGSNGWYHLTKVEALKLMFLWGNEKCEHTQI